MYLFESDEDASLVIHKRESTQTVSLDREGTRLRTPSGKALTSLTKVYSFDSLMAVSFLFGQEWWGRIFLLDPVLGGDREEELRFLQELVRQVGPAVYNVYLLRRLRQRAGAVERARFARELHDGAVQSLIAVEMQVDVVRRQSAAQSSPITAELARIQGLLREEVLKLRELMQQMKSLEVDSVEFHTVSSGHGGAIPTGNRNRCAFCFRAGRREHAAAECAGNWRASFRKAWSMFASTSGAKDALVRLAKAPRTGY